MFRSLNGLPSHVFFVHAPIVLIPLVSLAAVVLGLHKSPPAWLTRGVLSGVLITIAFTWAAVQSGQEFDEIIAGQVDTDRHESLANTTMLLVVGLGLAVAALLSVLRRNRDQANPLWRKARFGLSALTICFAVLSTTWVVQTGEEGARITWDGVIPDDDDGG
ncbi:MAG: hypothetical protein HKN03_09565 [Acidimicrobiales bacterium]|nr:hypothetical protein [Acidimicrobiales bacterium]